MTIFSSGDAVPVAVAWSMVRWGGVPGCGLGGYREGAIPGITQPSKIEAYLRYLRYIWFIRPFDWYFE